MVCMADGTDCTIPCCTHQFPAFKIGNRLHTVILSPLICWSIFLSWADFSPWFTSLWLMFACKAPLHKAPPAVASVAIFRLLSEYLRFSVGNTSSTFTSSCVLSFGLTVWPPPQDRSQSSHSDLSLAKSPNAKATLSKPLQKRLSGLHQSLNLQSLATAGLEESAHLGKNGCTARCFLCSRSAKAEGATLKLLGPDLCTPCRSFLSELVKYGLCHAVCEETAPSQQQTRSASPFLSQTFLLTPFMALKFSISFTFGPDENGPSLELHCRNSTHSYKVKHILPKTAQSYINHIHIYVMIFIPWHINLYVLLSFPALTISLLLTPLALSFARCPAAQDAVNGPTNFTRTCHTKYVGEFRKFFFLRFALLCSQTGSHCHLYCKEQSLPECQHSACICSKLRSTLNTMQLKWLKFCSSCRLNISKFNWKNSFVPWPSTTSCLIQMHFCCGNRTRSAEQKCLFKLPNSVQGACRKIVRKRPRCPPPHLKKRHRPALTNCEKKPCCCKFAASKAGYFSKQQVVKWSQTLSCKSSTAST